MQNVAYGAKVDLTPNVVYALTNEERCDEKKNCLIQFDWARQNQCEAKFVCFNFDGNSCENVQVNLRFERKVNLAD